MTDLIRREDAIRSAMSVPVFSPFAAQSEINIAVLVLAKVDTALRSLPAAPDPRDEVIRRLVEALEPLAIMAERYDPDDGDDGYLECWSSLAVPKIQHLRTARDALASAKEQLK